MKPKSTLRSFLALAGSTLLAISYTHAASVIDWDGDTSVTWATGTNWTGDTAPTSDLTTHIANFNLATYGGPVFAPSAGTTSINGITIGATNGAMTLTTTNLSIGDGGIAIANGAGALTVAGTVTIGAAQSWTNNDDDAATFGVIALGANKLTLAGGDFLFTGTNTGSGGIDLTGGNLIARLAGGFGPNTNTLFFKGGNLELRQVTGNGGGTTYTGLLNAVTNGGTITINRTDNTSVATTHIAGTLAIGGGNTLSVDAGSGINSGVNYGLALGATTLSGNAIFDVANNGAGVGTLILGALNQSGGPFTITKQGAGNLTLNAAANSSFTGSSINVTNGVLIANVAGALSSVATTSNNTTVNVSSTGELRGTVLGSFRSSGTGTPSQLINLSAGTLRLANTGSIVFAGNLDYTGGTVTLDRTASGAATTATMNSLSIGAITLTPTTANYTSTPTLAFGSTSITGNAVLDSSNVIYSLGNLTVSGGVTSVTAQGTNNVTAGTVTLPGSMSFTNNAAGTLTLGTITGGANTLTLDGNGAGLTSLNGGLSFTGAGGLVIDKSGTLGTTISGGTINLGGTGGITINNGASLFTLGAATISANQSWINNSSTAMVQTGVLTINSALTLGGGGFTLSQNNTGTGGITLTVGTLRATQANALGAGVGTLTLNGGILDLSNNSNTAFNRNTTVGADVTILSNRQIGSLGAGVTHTLGSLGIGANTLTVQGGDQVTSGTAAITFGATTFSGNTIFNVLPQNAFSNTLLTLGALSDGGSGRTITKNGSGNLTWGTITLSGNHIWAVNGGAFATLTSGAITGGAHNLTKTGDGLLVLSAANTGSGTYTLEGGVTRFNNATSLPGGTAATGGTSALTLNGGVLELGNGNFLRNLGSGVDQFQITGGASGFSSSGGDRTVTVNNTAATVVEWGSATFNPSTFVLNAITASHNITFSNRLDLKGDGIETARNIAVMKNTATLSGIIENTTNTIGLTKTGDGVLSLTNGSNSYNGATTISEGILQANSTGALGSASNTLVFNGGTLRAGGTITSLATRAVTMTSTGIIDTNNQTVSIAGNIGGAGGLTKTGGNTVALTGTLTLSGTNSYGGVTTVSGGALQFVNEASLYNGSTGSWTAANINVKNGAGLALNVGGSGQFSAANLNTLLTNISVANTADQGLQAGATLILDTANASGGTFTPSSALADSTGAFGGRINLIKVGAGTLILSQTPTYTGTTTINGGTIQYEDGITPSLLTSSGTLAVNTASGTLTQGSTFHSALFGTGSLNLTGGATLVLNAPNYHTGSTTATAGNITLSHALALQFSALNTTGAGTVTLSGVTTPTFGGLSNSGTARNLADVITTGYNGVTNLTLNPQSGTVTYDGVIANNAANLSLTKTGAGTQTLQGTNTYTGATTINGGTLNVSGTAGTINLSSAVTIGSGATLGLDNALGSLDRIKDSSTLTLNGGTLIFTGRGSSDSTTETIDTLAIGAGGSTITLTGAGASHLQTLSASAFSRTGNGTALIRGTSLQTAATNSTRLALSSSTGLTLIGGGLENNGVSTAGTTTTLSIVPYLMGDTSNSGAGSSFLTYDNSGALRPLAAGEYTTLAAGYTTPGTPENVNAFDGTITTASNVTVNSLRFNGTQALNGSGGALIVNSGTVALATNNAASIGSGFSGLTLGNGAWNEGIIHVSQNTLTINAPITINNNGVLTKAGGGILAVANTIGADTSTGLVVNAGTLRLSGTQSFTGGITLNGGSFGDKTTELTAAALNGNNITVNGDVQMGVANNTTITGNVLINSTGVFRMGTPNSGGSQIDGVLSGTGILAVNAADGAGSTITLANTANTFTGGVLFNTKATYALIVNSFLDSASPGAGNIVMNGAPTFALGSGAIAPLSFTNRQFEMLGSGRIANNSSQAFTINSNLNTSAYTGSRTLTLGGTGAGLSTFAGTITNGGLDLLNLTKNDANTWALTNTASSYNGVTNIINGTLEVTKLADGGNNSSIGASTNVATNLLFGGNALNAVLRYTGSGDSTDRSFTINGGQNGNFATLDASGTGAINFTNTSSPLYGTTAQTRTLILTGTNTGSNTLAANIGNNGGTAVTGAVSVTKNGVGTWVLSGNSSYTGTTTISAGTLLVNSPGSLAPASAVSVTGTATLGGNGTIGGNVTVAASANVSPGASPGTLSIGGNLDISALAGGAGKLNFELGANNALSSDKIAVTGTLNIGSGTLGLSDFNLSNLGGLQDGTYILISSSGLTGSLNGADVDDVETIFPGATIQLQTSGNNIVLAVSGLGGGTAYQAWATGNEPFDGDANGDGVQDGLAFLLGAVNPSENAIGRLPTVSESGGALIMVFNCLPTTARGDATLKVAHSNTLASWTATTDEVPDANDPTPDNNVTFVVVPGPAGPPALNTVTATIGSAAAAGGKLFGRLQATED